MDSYVYSWYRTWSALSWLAFLRYIQFGMSYLARDLVNPPQGRREKNKVSILQCTITYTFERLAEMSTVATGWKSYPGRKGEAGWLIMSFVVGVMASSYDHDHPYYALFAGTPVGLAAKAPYWLYRMLENTGKSFYQNGSESRWDTQDYSQNTKQDHQHDDQSIVCMNPNTNLCDKSSYVKPIKSTLRNISFPTRATGYGWTTTLKERAIPRSCALALRIVVLFASIRDGLLN